MVACSLASAFNRSAFSSLSLSNSTSLIVRSLLASNGLDRSSSAPQALANCVKPESVVMLVKEVDQNSQRKQETRFANACGALLDRSRPFEARRLRTIKNVELLNDRLLNADLLNADASQ